MLAVFPPFLWGKLC